ncbi:UNVERIFIED_CONTAM: Phosphate transporter [Sesamum radiatum]|uniref:Phosphate transporter n=1 Tax=Sesamum radiatum TaxID=300843 RepID=A0AAW2TVR6_SESRA
MVKFSKQFEGQLVPEWKEAFVDYRQLKKEIKKIHLLNDQNTNSKKRKSSLPNAIVSSLRKYTCLEHKQREPRVIQVHRKLTESASSTDLYETELLEQFADTDAAVEFFACLDLQLNKVNQFYRTKEKEFLERGESLKKQMEILTELKTALKQRHTKGPPSQDSKEEDSISGIISCDDESIKDAMDAEQGLENLTEEYDKEAIKFSETPMSGELERSMRMKKEDGKFRSLSGRVINYQGKNLRIHIPLTNPTRTFSAITYLLWDDLVNQSSKKCGPEGNKLHINKKKLHHAEKMIRGAFIELYKGLGYLKTYRNLNMLAFVKILKKFDKVTNKQVLPIYLRVVESSYFNSSDKALKLADEVEGLFVKNFAEDDKRKAMKYLKPSQRKESHAVTFFIGLFTGCFVALFVGYVIMAHITGMYRSNQTRCMETVYPVLSMFSLLFLHFFLYGCNIFMWRKTRINYSFIFELSPTKELKYRDVFLICTTSMTAVVGILFVHLSLVEKGYSYAQVQVIPGLLLLLFIVVLLCPFNIIYKSSRYRLLTVLRNIVLSPLYKVVMLDFFMADQLCSQVPMLRDLEYIACYYITGSYKTQDYNYCMRTTYYRDLAYAVSFLPYYWRAMQLEPKWHTRRKKCGMALPSCNHVDCATVYQLYWDFVKDWGLLQFNSKNPWLRDELILRQKFIYFFSMGLNLVLRLAWLQTVFHYNFGKVDYRVTMLFLAALEVVRRGQWNFYRLENEHLNNAGKFRAVKTVPLPFHEVDEQD